jgi:hypothetical protein
MLVLPSSYHVLPAYLHWFFTVFYGFFTVFYGFRSFHKSARAYCRLEAPLPAQCAHFSNSALLGKNAGSRCLVFTLLSVDGSNA